MLATEELDERVQAIRLDRIFLVQPNLPDDNDRRAQLVEERVPGEGTRDPLAQPRGEEAAVEAKVPANTIDQTRSWASLSSSRCR